MKKWTMTYNEIHERMHEAIKEAFAKERIPTIDLITAMESLKWHFGIQFLAPDGKIRKEAVL